MVTDREQQEAAKRLRILSSVYKSINKAQMSVCKDRSENGIHRSPEKSRS